MHFGFLKINANAQLGPANVKVNASLQKITYMYCTYMAQIIINVWHILGCWRQTYLVQRVDFSSAVTVVISEGFH